MNDTPSDQDQNPQQHRLVSLARDLILIPSTHGSSAERARCFTFLRNHLDSLPDIRIQMHESNGFESLVALPAAHPEPDILLIGHLDVIEHADLEVYTSRIDGDRLYGPGAGDMKGALALMLDLFVELHCTHPGISLGLTVTSDEERGSADGVRYLVEETGLRCGIAIVPDGGSLNEVTVEEKGVIHLELAAYGKAGHAARPWLVPNAASRLIAALRKLEEAFVVAEEKHEDNRHWYTTCVLTTLDTPSDTINCIPDEARATVDIRFVPPATVGSILTEVQAIVGDSIELLPRVTAEPTVLRPDPLWLEVAAEVTGKPVTKVRASGGSDGRFFFSRGIPVILSRPLVGNLHGEDEWIDIPSMATFRAIARQYILKRLRTQVP